VLAEDETPAAVIEWAHVSRFDSSSVRREETRFCTAVCEITNLHYNMQQSAVRVSFLDGARGVIHETVKNAF
jgi:hypothetical protein